MFVYDIDVVEGGRIIAASKSVALRTEAALWPEIAEIANTLGKSGCRIRVTNAAGEIEILVGVEAARSALVPTFAPLRGPRRSL